MTGEEAAVPGNSPLSALADRVRAAHGGVEVATKQALTCAMEAGAALNEAKRWVPHGGWAGWLSSIGVKERTAQLYMRLADRAEILKTATVADLTLRTAAEFVADIPTEPKPGRVFVARELASQGRMFGLVESLAHPGFFHMWSVSSDAMEQFTTRPARLAERQRVGIPARITRGLWDIHQASRAAWAAVSLLDESEDMNPFSALAEDRVPPASVVLARIAGASA